MGEKVYETDPDSRLMCAFQEGSEEAFDALFRKYSKPLLNYAYRFVGIRGAAEELTQEVFVKVYRSAASYEARSKFSTWIYRIATNTCLNELRRGEYKQVTVSKDQPRKPGEGRAAGDITDRDGIGAERELLARELETRAREVILAMPVKQRAALLMCRYQDLSYKEIADGLGCSVGAVKSLIHRGTLALKDALKPYLEEES